MRRPTLRVVEYHHSITARWVIEGIREKGKRKRKFFKTKTAAEQELTRIKTKLVKEGRDALSLSDSLRVMALEVSKDLERYGKTLRDAGDFYLKYLRESEKSITVEELTDEFLAMQRRAKRSSEHQSDLKIRHRRFCARFGKHPVRTITTKEIEAWLNELELSPNSINNFRARAAALFNYGIKRGYLERNPVTPIEQIKFVGAPPGIFTIDELRLLLDTAPLELLPMFAIGAFAGLRTAELIRLDWQDIDFKRGSINVSARKSKTAQRRVITMSPNLQAWLQPFASLTGKLWSRHEDSYNHAAYSARKAAGLERWPHNALRHSFASYHLAKHQNAAKLALEMGHEGAHMIFNHYREIVTPEEAERYWNILPALPADNVVPMAQAS